MKTQTPFLFLLLLFMLISCGKLRICDSNLITKKNIDLAEAHYIASRYCVVGYENYKLDKISHIKLNIYDKDTNNFVKEGVIWINNLKINFVDGIAEHEIEPGVYVVDVSSYSSSNLSIKIKDLNLLPGKSLELNVFLGSSRQF